MTSRLGPMGTTGMHGPTDRGVGTVRAVLAVPNYRRFVAGQSVSLVGSWTETIALALLVLDMTHSSVTLGLVMATRYLPVLICTSYAGVLVDRNDKRHLLFLTSGVLGATTLAVGLTVLTHTIALWQIFVAAAVFGLMTCLDNPARMAFVPELVGPELLRPAITTNSILANVGRTLGPAVAAFLAHSYGLGWCFVFNAASFALVIIALLALHTSALQPTRVVARARGQLRQGLAVARTDRELAGPLVMMAFVGTLAYEFETSLPVFAEQTLSAGVDGYSWLTTAFGIGSVAMGLILLRWPVTGLRRMVFVAIAYAVAMALLTVSPTVHVGVLTAVVVGAASIAFLTTGNSTIQLSAPPQLRGRVTALWTTLFVGSTPIGAVLIGVIAHHFGGRAALGSGVAGCVLAAGAGLVILLTTRPRSEAISPSERDLRTKRSSPGSTRARQCGTHRRSCGSNASARPSFCAWPRSPTCGR
ncbi:MFS transporter [Mycolicibacterium komossense]|uniref:MFS transporter n=1 Tax=Mycolicibacterium komossense TaxID=1779 RepID=A0ABT3CID5_9MYCO|nr:MFS transporter [Mycolicibacterium komossense]MCV7229220.1 MFS transporter [Mycolicibacterium komossense]